MGERDLQRLLKTARPFRQPGTYVFVSLPEPVSIPEQEILMRFREAEGTTLILQQGTADAYGLRYSLTCWWITMEVHSALEAVGFTAAFAAALTKANISCNVVAGFYHDHLFLPAADGQRGMEVLQALG